MFQVQSSIAKIDVKSELPVFIHHPLTINPEPSTSCFKNSSLAQFLNVDN